SVREAGEVVAAGRTTSRKTPAASPPDVNPWRNALEKAPAEEPLRAALERLLQDSLDGARPDELDRRLDEELMRCAPTERKQAAEDASRAALAPFRARMESTEHARAIARATIDRLREAYALPRAALSPPSKIG
ncbi:MAG TPA: hypothetical protein VJ826_14790, partial [Candidatus Polarisedimenticolaceae bacterium]|nr:hypothetical protein [Candidatus Polarisedimenticolaceae bacterium]